MYNISLNWKRLILSGEGTEESPYVYGDQYNINCFKVDEWLKANAGESYCGLSANSKLECHFSSEPSEEIKQAILDKWDSITEESEEATSYKSKEELTEEEAIAVAALKLSVKTKLLALGLSEAEIDALKK